MLQGVVATATVLLLIVSAASGARRVFYPGAVSGRVQLATLLGALVLAPIWLFFLIWVGAA